MSTSTKLLYLFLVACSGNWRNCLYVFGQEDKDTPDCLLAMDWDGRPIVMSVDQFHQLTGIRAESAECCGYLTEEGFRSLFRQYLIWHTASDGTSPLLLLSKQLQESL